MTLGPQSERKRLDEYFDADGRDEPVQITVPKGAYVPNFEPRVEIAAAPNPTPAKVDNLIWRYGPQRHTPPAKPLRRSFRGRVRFGRGLSAAVNRRRFPIRDLGSALQLIAARQYTSLADTNIASRLVELSRDFGGNRAPVRYARHLLSDNGESPVPCRNRPPAPL
jgi:hypothetical protein